MKKTLLLVLVLAAVVAATVVFLRKGKSDEVQAAELAPADALVYMELPDVGRTLERWKKTSLYQIAQEPEWQAFTAKFGDFVRDNLPDKSLGGIFEQLKTADPAGAFIAFTSVSGNAPSFVGGFPYRGTKTAAKGAIEQMRTALLKGGPPLKSELSTVEGTEVEVLSAPGVTVELAYRDNWFLFATSADLMKGLLQRYAGAAGAPASLAKDTVFVESAREGALDPDFVMFARVKKIEQIYEEDRVSSLKKAGVTVPPRPASPMDVFIPEAMNYTMKLDGPLMRDRAYVRIPNWPKISPLSNRLLAATTRNSFGYGAINLEGLESFTKPLFASIDEEDKDRPVEKKLREKGLKYADLGSAFGPELAFYSDWEKGGTWPTFFFAMEVRDPAKARVFAEAWVGDVVGESRQPVQTQEGGTTFWTISDSPESEMPWVVAYNAKHVVFGLNKAQTVAGLKHLNETSNLSQSEAYQTALRSVVSPTGALFYLDLRPPIERAYEQYVEGLKGLMASAPGSAKYFDATKFPGVEVITKHLQPSVVSYGDAPSGFVVDASGSLPIFGTMVPAGLLWFVAVPSTPMRVAPVQTTPTPAPTSSPEKK